MTTVRAKFTCISVTKSSRAPTGFLWAYEFNVVYGDNEENKAFFASTPMGSIKIGSVRDDLFEVGQEYYVDFIQSVEQV